MNTGTIKINCKRFTETMSSGAMPPRQPDANGDTDMAYQRITIDVKGNDETGHHWYLFGGTGEPITDSTKWGDKMCFSSAEGALKGATKAAHKLLWIERSCAA